LNGLSSAHIIVDMKEVILSQEDIRDIVKDLGARLTHDLASEERPPVFLCVMKGALPFYSDLIKEVKRDIVCDYIQISSYGGGLSSSGTIHLTKDLDEDLNGRTLVIVEDIVDTGLSMHFLLEHIHSRFKTKKTLICALFDKDVNRKNEVRVDYCGRKLREDKFLCGYGLDYKEILRNTPYVFVPTDEEIDNWNKELG